MFQTAAFGRLCVETLAPESGILLIFQPPSGGCVLKQPFAQDVVTWIVSRLRAAVC